MSKVRKRNQGRAAPDQFLGRRVSVWWDTEGDWFEGQVTLYDQRKKYPYAVDYADGDRTWEKCWEWDEANGDVVWLDPPPPRAKVGKTCEVASRGGAPMPVAEIAPSTPDSSSSPAPHECDRASGGEGDGEGDVRPRACARREPASEYKTASSEGESEDTCNTAEFPAPAEETDALSLHYIGGSTNRWFVPKSYRRLSFNEFVSERHRILLKRQRGVGQEAWTQDLVLRHAKFCNIDRSQDRVTREAMHVLDTRPWWSLRQKILFLAALRFTSSRRGVAETIAACVDDERPVQRPRPPKPGRPAPPASALSHALETKAWQCGHGTYQMCLNRPQAASKLEPTVDALLERVRTGGPFATVGEASDFIASGMTVSVGRGRSTKRPQFSANETAKDLEYLGGLVVDDLQGEGAGEVNLGPGAQAGLQRLQAAPGPGDPAVAGLPEQLAVREVRRALVASDPALHWLRVLDVEQALCEYSKYIHYSSPPAKGNDKVGISREKIYCPP